MGSLLRQNHLTMFVTLTFKLIRDTVMMVNDSHGTCHLTMISGSSLRETYPTTGGQLAGLYKSIAKILDEPWGESDHNYSFSFSRKI